MGDNAGRLRRPWRNPSRLASALGHRSGPTFGRETSPPVQPGGRYVPSRLRALLMVPRALFGPGRCSASDIEIVGIYRSSRAREALPFLARAGQRWNAGVGRGCPKNKREEVLNGRATLRASGGRGAQVPSRRMGLKTKPDHDKAIASRSASANEG